MLRTFLSVSPQVPTVLPMVPGASTEYGSWILLSGGPSIFTSTVAPTGQLLWDLCHLSNQDNHLFSIIFKFKFHWTEAHKASPCQNLCNYSYHIMLCHIICYVTIVNILNQGLGFYLLKPFNNSFDSRGFWGGLSKFSRFLMCLD